MQKHCTICGTLFNKQSELSRKQWEARVCCSRACSAKLTAQKLKGRTQSDETRKLKSEQIKLSYKTNPKSVARRIKSLKKTAADPEYRAKKSQIQLEYLATHPRAKQQMVKRLRAYNNSAEGKAFLSQHTKALWEKGVFNETHIEKLHEGLKRSWRDNRDTRLKLLSKNYTPEEVRKRAVQVTGEKASYWKGDEATYNSKHRWIQKRWKKTGVCEQCNTHTQPFGKRHFGTEWANKAHDYNRMNREDWMELCPKCHAKYDKQFNKTRRSKDTR